MFFFPADAMEVVVVVPLDSVYPVPQEAATLPSLMPPICPTDVPAERLVVTDDALEVVVAREVVVVLPEVV